MPNQHERSSPGEVSAAGSLHPADRVRKSGSIVTLPLCYGPYNRSSLFSCNVPGSFMKSSIRSLVFFSLFLQLGMGMAQERGSGRSERQPATMAGVSSDTVYHIGPEDSLQITVWKEPTMSGTFPVRPDGMISLLSGEVKAAGLTPAQLRDAITESLKKYIQDPLVTVVVAAVNSQKIFLLGEVQHVGQLPLSPGMTPLQAISAAGGLTAYANAKKIYILREQAGKETRIPFDYKAALKGQERQTVTLLSGDTIVVK